ncbi:MAG: gfo/Idh/MocA family oxidoreductase, partial [Alphaproteobacteria bacterium]|nr:gfo/Idh/MocA family oxidoreductase [Alphaproteobacteria bacterium]
RVSTQLIEHEVGPPPIDSLSIMLEFANRLSGQMATLRALPLYFRVAVFGVKGTAELRGETEVTVRIGGTTPRVLSFAPINSQRAELEAFADAVDGRAPYPISFDSMLATVAAFEAVVKSVARKGAPMDVG